MTPGTGPAHHRGRRALPSQWSLLLPLAAQRTVQCLAMLCQAADAAIEAMNGQYLCNRAISVSYAFKKDTKGEQSQGVPEEGGHSILYHCYTSCPAHT